MGGQVPTAARPAWGSVCAAVSTKVGEPTDSENGACPAMAERQRVGGTVPLVILLHSGITFQ